MKILAVDTATKSCSVAVIDEDSLLAESTSVIDQTHSRQLLNIIDTVLGETGLKITQLDGFAVSIGPGSFTGLRIGITSVKGLAFSLNKPVVGVSSLETLAFQCLQKPYLICPVLDARKQEVYFCHYRCKNGKLEKESPERVAAAAEAVRGIREPCVFIGNGAILYQDLISTELRGLAHFVAENQHTIQAAAVARLSLPRFKRQETDNVHLLVPHYIRKSDAELKIRMGNTLKF
ncbi:tRNA threonylcarbamoyladenosine biosynthesis protein TsaB [Olavius sp. associated proteobacterium Delta 1]|nr:tRNA threonylcarbamoyladenosine biosynthesis protein TsaB [Olavius sp. associated proteobacterium Delta 1]